MSDDMNSPLLTDLYQLNMIQAYLEHGKMDEAVFEFFVRRLPASRAFLVAAGLEQALDYLEDLKFSPKDIDWLNSTNRFSADMLSFLEDLRFTGDVHAMPEGTVFYPDEPVLRITAPLPVAQLVESRLINLLHFETLIASKAARFKLAAPDKQLVDFGLRRAHAAEAGLLAARASYIAGFAGTATVLAGQKFAIPLYGTMAHAFIQAFDDEHAAFEAFAQSRPDHLVLLIDTYDTEAAAHKIVALAPQLNARGIRISGVRIDSGDLIALSRNVREILDSGGLNDVVILASGGIDEPDLKTMMAADAPIDGFGIGTSLTTSADVPSLDSAYKLQELAGVPRRKRSPGKETWPGRKQVWRRFGPDGRMTGDILSLEREVHDGTALIEPVMTNGRRLGRPSITEIRGRTAANLASLPEPHTRLDPDAAYNVDVAPSLKQLVAAIDGDIGTSEG
ncbi:MAG: nicotinate phosphoribosyltransferase [Pseudomonadota bacterium]